jgi:tripartite-type tricarboxylate transporter receptor subunit TctC
MLIILRAAMVAAFALLSTAACAQTWPQRSIRVLVGFSPGSTLDIMARALAVPLTQQLGQSVVVENRPGSSGTLALGLLANSPLDGYTIELTGTGPISISPFVQKITLAPLQPISLVGRGPMALVVRASLPIKSIAELIAAAKEKPGSFFYASSGVGSTPHLAGEIFAIKAGVKLTHVPYKGNLDAINDVLAGRVQITFSGLPPVLPQITAGRMRALAIAATERNEALPDVPTMAEANLPGAEALSHYGFLAPAGLPPQVIARLHDEIAKAVAIPEIATTFKNLGAESRSSTPEEYGKIIADDSAKWKAVVTEANITSE